MAEWQNSCLMAEWSNGRNAGLADRMAEWLLNGRMVKWREWLPTYYFMVHADDDDTNNTDDTNDTNDTF